MPQLQGIRLALLRLPTTFLDLPSFLSFFYDITRQAPLLKIEAVYPSETLIYNQKTTRSNNANIRDVGVFQDYEDICPLQATNSLLFVVIIFYY
jgi:hypothetical protein